MAAATEVLTIEEYLERSERQELLRFTTAGSVDDGKSTLIGRLLYDANGMFEDQLAAIRASKLNRSSGPIDFSLLTDGLRAEREQGITIDVAYRHFSTPRRKFIIADTPGHEQYTRNMATGASTAEVAVILIDARNGVLPQSRRHAFIAALLGIPRLVAAVNKMDLAGWRREVFEAIRDEFAGFLRRIDAPAATFIPVSALDGDNVAWRGGNSPWYAGPTLLEYLETVPIAADAAGELRFPVQYVNRPNSEFRGFAGQIASGTVQRGDTVMSLPSGRTSRVKSIVTYDGELDSAHEPQSITLCLEDEIDVSRGDMLVHASRLPHVSRHFEAMCVWMSAEPLRTGAPYILKQTTQQVRATITLLDRVDVNTLERAPAEALGLNDIGTVAIETANPLFFDSYRRNRATGAFILIDPASNGTVGAGMIADPRRREAGKTAVRAVEHGAAKVTPGERLARLGHAPATIWLTARLEVASVLERKLFDRGCLVQVLADRAESGILPELAEVLHAAGAIVICSVAGEMAEECERARQYVGAERFVELDPESLPPRDDAAADKIVAALEARGIIRPAEAFWSGEGI